MLSTLDLLASSILFCVPRWPRIQFAAKKSYFGTCMVVIIFMYYPFLLWLQCRIISFQQSPNERSLFLASFSKVLWVYDVAIWWALQSVQHHFVAHLWKETCKALELLYYTYTFLNIAIFIIIAVDPKWRATSSAQLKTFSNLVKEEKNRFQN